MDKEQLTFDHLRKILLDFQEERRRNLKRESTETWGLLKRYIWPGKEYPRLMEADLGFFQEKQRVLRNEVESKGITAEELEHFLVTLKAHIISGLQARYKKLVNVGLILATVVAMLNFFGMLSPTDINTSVIFIGILLLFKERILN